MESILLSIGFVGIIVAIMTPLVKLGTFTSIVSLIGYFYFMDVNDWLPIILFTMGLLFIVLEIFIPDFGLIGILGAGSLIGGLYLTTGDLSQAITDFTIALIITVGIVVLLIRQGYSLSNANKLILKSNVGSSSKARERVKKEKAVAPGLTGSAVTPLRPSGKVVFHEDEPAYDVLSAEGHISKGTDVIIDNVQGTKILVRRFNHPRQQVTE